MFLTFGKREKETGMFPQMLLLLKRAAADETDSSDASFMDIQTHSQATV